MKFTTFKKIFFTLALLASTNNVKPAEHLDYVQETIYEYIMKNPHGESWSHFINRLIAYLQSNKQAIESNMALKVDEIIKALKGLIDSKNAMLVGIKLMSYKQLLHPELLNNISQTKSKLDERLKA